MKKTDWKSIILEEIKNLQEAVKVNFEDNTFALKVDVNEDPNKKGIKVQFLPTSFGSLTRTEQDDIAISLGDKLSSGLKEYGMDVERDRNLKDKSIIGFFIYVEYLDKTVNTDSTLIGVVNGDSSSLTSLDHLEGESSTILIGDAVYPKQTVTSGAITISLPSTTSTKTVEVGLGYTSTLKTLRVEAGGQTGTSQGRKKRYNEVMVRLLNTVGATINGDQLPFRTSSTPMGQNIPEFTGDKRVTNLGWDRDGQITVEQTQPLPMTILGITGTLVTSD